MPTKFTLAWGHAQIFFWAWCSVGWFQSRLGIPGFFASFTALLPIHGEEKEIFCIKGKKTVELESILSKYCLNTAISSPNSSRIFFLSLGRGAFEERLSCEVGNHLWAKCRVACLILRVFRAQPCFMELSQQQTALRRFQVNRHRVFIMATKLKAAGALPRIFQEIFSQTQARPGLMNECASTGAYVCRRSSSRHRRRYMPRQTGAICSATVLKFQHG